MKLNRAQVNLDDGVALDVPVSNARPSTATGPRCSITGAEGGATARTAPPPAPPPARRQRLECRRRRPRAGSCSSSDLSDDDSEKKKRAAENADAPPERARRDSHDDSSDSQERGAGAGARGSRGATFEVRTSPAFDLPFYARFGNLCYVDVKMLIAIYYRRRALRAREPTAAARAARVALAELRAMRAEETARAAVGAGAPLARRAGSGNRVRSIVSPRFVTPVVHRGAVFAVGVDFILIEQPFGCGAGGGGSGGALGGRRPGGPVRATAAAAAGGRASAAYAASPARPVLAPARWQPRARQRPARGPRPLVALKEPRRRACSR